MDYQSILEKIKDRDIALEEIKRMDLDNRVKAILLYAYYEVLQARINLEELLDQEFWAEDEETLQIKASLVERSKQNEKDFDIGYFTGLIMGIVNKNNAVNDLLKRINLLIETGELAEALTLCQKPILASNLTGIKYRIAILKQLKRYEEALEICETCEFKDEYLITLYRISLLMVLGRYEEALVIAKKSQSTESAVLDDLISKTKRDIDNATNTVVGLEDGDSVTYDRWGSIWDKLSSLVSQCGDIACEREQVEFLSQLIVNLSMVVQVGELVDNLAQGLGHVANEVPDGDGDSHFSLDIESY